MANTIPIANEDIAIEHVREILRHVNEGVTNSVRFTHDDDLGWCIEYLVEGEFNGYAEHGYGRTLTEAFRMLSDEMTPDACPICQRRLDLKGE